MIQEMFKGSIPNPPLSTTTTLTSSKITNNNNNNNNDNNSESNSRQKLRCPRCESTNTKFCYYNNYNLTQPRHFCKSCRRYWTKGGTLRNVPIGGGCRKNKSSHNNNNNNNIITAKAKSVLSTEFFINGNNNNNNPGNFLGPGLLDPIPLHPDLQLSGPIPSPNIWASLALLRGATARLFPSPIPASNSNNFTTANSTLGLGLDPYGNGAPNQMVNGFGLLDPEQRIKSSSGNNYNYCGNENQGDVILGNVMTSSSDNVNVNSTVLEGIPNHMGGSGGYGIKNNFGISSWTEFPTVPN